MRKAKLVALALGALLVGSGTSTAAAQSRIIGTNEVRADTLLATVNAESGVSHCQDPERFPAGTAALLLSLQPTGGRGPAVRVTARRLQRGGLVASGARRAGWSEAFVVVPLRRVVRHAARVRLCMTIAPGAPIAMHGTTDPATHPGEPYGPRVHVDFLRATAPHRVSVHRSADTPAIERVAELLGVALGLAEHTLGG